MFDWNPDHFVAKSRLQRVRRLRRSWTHKKNDASRTLACRRIGTERGMNNVSRTMIVAAALMAAGCANLPGGSIGQTFTQQSFLSSSIGDDSFNGMLAREYQKLAVANAVTQVNWLDSTVYRQRAEAAAAGSPMPLFEPASFGVNGELESLRASTIATVNANAAERPAACAEMMALYDQLVEWTFQPGLDASVARAAYDSAAAACSPSAMTGDMVVFFGFDRSDLTAAAMATIDEIVGSLSDAVSAISVVGHTDTVGSLQYNQGLSERRAASVANRMVSLGVDPGIITRAGRSWTEPAVDTGPNVREARNRRVEITVSE
ncbi:MAG: OmpA family protein [Rhodobacteraceae bacterium]|nr:MAG: OmpA family protein [Paracoccaceae bacterium]